MEMKLSKVCSDIELKNPKVSEFLWGIKIHRDFSPRESAKGKVKFSYNVSVKNVEYMTALFIGSVSEKNCDTFPSHTRHSQRMVHHCCIITWYACTKPRIMHSYI